MSRFLNTRAWRPIAVALVAGGIGVGGYWLGQNRPAGAVQAQVSTASTASPAPTPQGLDPKAVKVSARPGGTVTAIMSDPAGFTFRLDSGEDKTVRVVDGTIFQAGRDRPYSFGLLKVGDLVRVQAPGLGPKAAAGQANPSGAATKPNGAARKPNGAGSAFAPDGTPIARRVIVRPAGEKPLGAKKLGAGQAGADQTGPAGSPPAGARQQKGGPGRGIQ